MGIHTAGVVEFAGTSWKFNLGEIIPESMRRHGVLVAGADLTGEKAAARGTGAGKHLLPPSTLMCTAKGEVPSAPCFQWPGGCYHGWEYGGGGGKKALAMRGASSRAWRGAEM